MPEKEKKIYDSQPQFALVMLIGALVAIFGTGIWSLVKGPVSPSIAGGAAAAVAVLLAAAIVLQWPATILDDAPDNEGQVSTMRIGMLAVVLTFCVLMLNEGWAKERIPSLAGQSEWVWLVTAAFLGKTVQKYAEVQEKKKELDVGKAATTVPPKEEVPELKKVA